MRFRPMLPVERPVLPEEKGFVHEIKWDGYRVLSYLDGEEVHLESRNGKLLNVRFPQVVQGLQGKNLQVVLDGEVVALNKEGQVDFSLLSQKGDPQICYIVFDLLYDQGKNLCPDPWFERRARLDTLLKSDELIVLSPLLPGYAENGIAFAKEHHFEGIVSKKEDSPYLEGTRSPFWRKQKIRRSLDCILVGLKIKPQAVRSMALALYQNDESLFYLGNVGSGLGERELDFLRQAVDLLASDHCPCVNPPEGTDSWIWFKPLVVVEIEYFELTPKKRLRHPVFLRFRFDKNPKECTLEECSDGY